MNIDLGTSPPSLEKRNNNEKMYKKKRKKRRNRFTSAFIKAHENVEVGEVRKKKRKKMRSESQDKSRIAIVVTVTKNSPQLSKHIRFFTKLVKADQDC